MNLSESVLVAVPKMRAICNEHTDAGDALAHALDRILEDLEHAARQPCERCATYEMVLDLCVASLPRPARYGEIPWWIERLVSIAEAARTVADIDARIAKLEER